MMVFAYTRSLSQRQVRVTLRQLNYDLFSFVCQRADFNKHFRMASIQFDEENDPKSVNRIIRLGNCVFEVLKDTKFLCVKSGQRRINHKVVGYNMKETKFKALIKR